MTRRTWFKAVSWFLGAWVGAVSLSAVAEDRAESKGSGASAIDLFDAIDGGQITVKVIPKDETQVRLHVTNTADRPLVVRMPAAIAAVPVLAQNFGMFNNPGGQPGGNGLFGGNPGGGAGRTQALGIGGGGNGLGMGQGFGPGMGPGMNGMQGFNNGFPGGFMNVPEKRVLKIDLPAVCLEFGKKSPNHRSAYELRRVDQWTSDPLVASVVSALNDRRLDREVVQVAAWRATSGWTWDEMRRMTVVRPWGAVESRFDPVTLVAAQKLTERLAKGAQLSQTSQTTAAR